MQPLRGDRDERSTDEHRAAQGQFEDFHFRLLAEGKYNNVLGQLSRVAVRNERQDGLT
jgi:hypothetical protein